MSQMEAYQQAQEAQTNQDFPSPSPEITAHHTALILKRRFWKVGHKLQQAVLSQSQLLKQTILLLPGNSNRNYGFSKVGA